MPQKLEELEIREVSLVDRPANSSTDEATGRKVAHARVALFKRDEAADEGEELLKAVQGKTEGGVVFPKGDYAYTPDDVPSHWKLRLTKSPGGAPDAGIVGAAVAALGKGFRGNRVVIPGGDLPAVKSRVRSAWKQANPDKGGEELPEVLKGESMTLEQIEQQVVKQEGVLAQLTSENAFLKAERETVLKMSKKQRKAYASMSDSDQKSFMAGDADKRKEMCDTAMKVAKERQLEEGMDVATKAEFAKAGPSRRIQMLADAEKLVAKAAKAAKPDSADADADSGDDEEDDDSNLQLRKSIGAANKMAADAADRIAKAEGELTELRKRERLAHFAKRAELELPNTSGSPVEKGTHLMTVADALPGGEGGEVFKTYMGNLCAADKALTIHFGEVGKHGGPIPAEKALLAKADEISKRDKISVSHAMAKAMDESPELYIQYEQQRRAQINAA